MSVSVYDTTSTEMTAALMAVGYDLIKTDPIRRIFTDRRPANPAVTHGLQRGGEVQFRLETEGDQFNAKIGDVAQAYAMPDDKAAQESEAFDALVAELRSKLVGTEGGILLEKVIAELPKEIARYIRVAMDTRRDLIQEIATRKDMVELAKVRKSDDHYMLHHIDCPKDVIENLS